MAQTSENRRRPVFAYTGQGSQYPLMTALLWREHPVYRRYLDCASKQIMTHTGVCVSMLLQSGDTRIDETGFTQPAVFAVQYALTATLAEAGIEPGAVIGHSIGEFAAAVAAGALSLADAAYLVARRGAMMQRLPAGGGMLAVSAAPQDCAPELAAEPQVGVGAFNGPDATVLSGESAALDRIAQQLTARGVRNRRLNVSHAFHSPLMQPMVGAYRTLAAAVPSAPPALPFYSTVRGGPLGPDDRLDADYWAGHAGGPVCFAQAATALLQSGHRGPVLEIGPKPVLVKLIGRLARALDLPAPQCFAAVQNERTGSPDLEALIAQVRAASVEPAGAPV